MTIARFASNKPAEKPLTKSGFEKALKQVTRKPVLGESGHEIWLPGRRFYAPVVAVLVGPEPHQATVCLANGSRHVMALPPLVVPEEPHDAGTSIRRIKRRHS